MATLPRAAPNASAAGAQPEPITTATSWDPPSAEESASAAWVARVRGRLPGSLVHAGTLRRPEAGAQPSGPAGHDARMGEPQGAAADADRCARTAAPVAGRRRRRRVRRLPGRGDPALDAGSRALRAGAREGVRGGKSPRTPGPRVAGCSPSSPATAGHWSAASACSRRAPASPRPGTGRRLRADAGGSPPRRSDCSAGGRSTRWGCWRVEWAVDPDNAGSRGVAERAGFRAEGLVRQRFLHRGQPSDVVLYSLLASDSFTLNDTETPATGARAVLPSNDAGRGHRTAGRPDGRPRSRARSGRRGATAPGRPRRRRTRRGEHRPADRRPLEREATGISGRGAARPCRRAAPVPRTPSTAEVERAVRRPPRDGATCSRSPAPTSTPCA